MMALVRQITSLLEIIIKRETTDPDRHILTCLCCTVCALSAVGHHTNKIQLNEFFFSWIIALVDPRLVLVDIQNVLYTANLMH